ncbi:MAG: multiheme c-type cytochrome [Steroidobacteraceae bacterium]
MQARVLGAGAAAAAYVDNAQCLECHADQAQRWQQSHHAMAMAVPSARSVRGDFDGTAFTHAGVTSRFFRRDGKYFVNTDGPDGRLADFEVAYTFGVAPLQQYLVALPGGRLQALQVAWDTERQRWFHLRAGEKTPPGDVLHWTGRYQTANTMCITCHTTGYEKHYDPATDTFASRWVEPNVSCQACHGAGSVHVAWARAKQQGGQLPDVAGTHFGLAVDRRMLAGHAQVDACSSCHARRSELTARPMPGEPRLDDYLPVLLTEGLYHPDGQQLDEVFVDASYRQSRMYAKGVACTHCHDAHSGQLKFDGNAVCTQCHGVVGNPAFPTAARRNYDSPAHHFHQPGSPGARCVACHMPAKTYMQVQARPDHAIRIPRPDLSVKLATPNACNQCHADKSAQWAASQVARWYGPGRRQEAHYGEVFAAARADAPDAGAALLQLVADAQQPAIVRATALEALGAYAAGGIDVRTAATRDPDPQVRAAAANSFAALPASEYLAALAPLLKDPARAVRIAAAQALSAVPLTNGRASGGRRLTRRSPSTSPHRKCRWTCRARTSTWPWSTNTGKVELAEQHYLAALRLDPDFTPARANLAAVQRRGPQCRCRGVLAEGLKRNPAIGELQYCWACCWPSLIACPKRPMHWPGHRSCCPGARACTTTWA